MHDSSSNQDSVNVESEEVVDKLAAHADEPEIGFLTEFVMFLRENKKWWLIPLVGSLLLVGAISLLAASGAAPFIYTIF